ncbi:TRAP transporter large permease [Anoxynatronum sibiricum]|uniref:TRAP transporter large permease n=1 Tax=Anoxynatronum sibiricum TaxID=210623 RepID=A0ABU9VTP2_9CLOT
MSPVALTLFGSLFILLILNVPIAVSLALSSVVTLFIFDIPLSIFPFTMYTATAKFTLLAIPFFILAGTIMEKSGISKRLINFANLVVGHLKGGLAIVTVLTSCFFAAISGSGPATVAALGNMLVPAMEESGYDKGMSAALLSASGAIGIIIPPSIAFVVYGVVAQVSIGKLFIAGIIPGLLFGLMLIVASLIVSRKYNIKQTGAATGKQLRKAFVEAVWGIMTPVIILGGIYGGIFTPTEAAGVAVFYGLIVGLFIYRDLKPKAVPSLLVESSVSSAVVMLIVAAASLFAWIITTQGIARDLADVLLSITSNKYGILMIINIILLIAGCFIDAVSAYYILMPIFLPILNIVGIDLLHFGVVMTVNLAIGQITPPVGVNLYVACGIADIGINRISKSIVPFLVASLVALLLVTYLPILSLGLPALMGM